MDVASPTTLFLATCVPWETVADTPTSLSSTTQTCGVPEVVLDVMTRHWQQLLKAEGTTASELQNKIRRCFQLHSKFHEQHNYFDWGKHRREFLDPLTGTRLPELQDLHASSQRTHMAKTVDDILQRRLIWTMALEAEERRYRTACPQVMCWISTVHHVTVAQRLPRLERPWGLPAWPVDPAAAALAKWRGAVALLLAPRPSSSAVPRGWCPGMPRLVGWLGTPGLAVQATTS